ncbi:putative nuclease HARBI1 [Anthonomus grandis grandis]|uniref:putative nuclease HARBI1 n=1 Tax=Anthonomus grandis grandis TaxID=2921223 RepID=UPI002164F69E|nr:putative nuclease HARBI1 [Anthonomus grandis grandis]
MRAAIPPRIKLEITLAYLATGNSCRTLQRLFRVSRPAISNFIPEVCDAIYEALQEYIKVPASEEEWKVIENGFRQRWNFPNCYGVIDGKHFVIHAPAHCGSEFFNYKRTNSIVLLAVVDDNYCFRYINVGCSGRQSDGGVFQQSSLSQALEYGLLSAGGFIVGDDAFPLKEYLMKPFSKVVLSKEQKVFNYRLSRARRIVENGFGIMVSRFRIFEKPIACLPETIYNKIIKTCCALHNYLRITSSNNYTPSGSLDEEDLDRGQMRFGSWRDLKVRFSPMEKVHSNHSAKSARNMRDQLCQYFMGEGAVPWQERMIF